MPEFFYPHETMIYAKSFLAGLLCLSCAAAIAAPTAVIKTSEGTITVDLNENAAPKTVANFVRYAKEGAYNGTIFHRVIPNFMIQGGGMDAAMKPKPAHEPIALERGGLKNTTGTIAMARTNDPNSATNQFFINLKDNDFLNTTAVNPGYAVFGKVTSGMDVVRKIGRAPTTSKGFHDDVPIRPITIESVQILK